MKASEHSVSQAAVRRIGVLGGSFNPAHEGHLYIARQALEKLALDEVWLMVSPQNPLKSRAGMAPFTERLQSAEAVAAGEDKIRATDIERQLGTVFTFETMQALKRRFPQHRFLWLMGEDNFIQLADWKGGEHFGAAFPFAVFPRAWEKGAVDYRPSQTPDFLKNRERPLAEGPLLGMVEKGGEAGWVRLDSALHPLSSTQIRAFGAALPSVKNS